MHIMMSQDGADVKQSESLALRKIRHTSSARAHYGSTLIETMNALVNYIGPMDLKYRVEFVDGCMKGKDNSTLPSLYIQ